MDGFIGEIRAFAFGFVPQSWIECNGQMLAPAQYAALFSILSTTYGGNGSTTFALPDLRGRTPLGAGNGPGLTFRQLGTSYGGEGVALLASQIPPHDHTLTMEQILPTAGTNNFTGTPTANSSWLSHPVQVTGPTAAKNIPAYTAGTSFNSNLHPYTIGFSGNNPQPVHENRQPYLPMMFCICYDGEYPTRP